MSLSLLARVATDDLARVATDDLLPPPPLDGWDALLLDGWDDTRAIAERLFPLLVRKLVAHMVLLNRCDLDVGALHARFAGGGLDDKIALIGQLHLAIDQLRRDAEAAAAQMEWEAAGGLYGAGRA